MLEVFHDGGFIMYPLTMVAALILFLAVRSGLQLRAAARPDLVLEARIDGILFWGAWGMIVGLLGTMIGIVQAAQAIERAGGAPTPLVWGGIKVTLVTTVFGLLLLSIAGLLWFGLRSVYRRRVRLRTAP